MVFVFALRYSTGRKKNDTKKREDALFFLFICLASSAFFKTWKPMTTLYIYIYIYLTKVPCG